MNYYFISLKISFKKKFQYFLIFIIFMENFFSFLLALLIYYKKKKKNCELFYDFCFLKARI